MAPVPSGDFAAIEAALTWAAPRVRDHWYTTFLNPDSSEYRRIAATQVEGDAEKQFVANVLQDVLGWPAGGMVTYRTSSTSGAGERTTAFAGRLIARARLIPPADVVADFRSLLETNSLRQLEVLSLWGLHPEKPIDLPEGIRLLPLALVPPSTPRDYLLGVERLKYPSGGFGVFPRPRAALIHERTLAPVFDMATPGVANFPAGDPSSLELLRDVSGILVLLGHGPVFEIMSWSQAPEDGLIGGANGSQSRVIRWPHQFRIDPAAIDEARCQALVAAYLVAPEDVRRALRVPLDRLNSASLPAMAVQAVDRAIDLGIALESLLVPDTAPEILHRLCLRASVLLEGSEEERHRRTNRLKAVYKLRSGAAHGGTVEGSPTKADETLAAGTAICTQLIRTVIDHASRPDFTRVSVGLSPWPTPRSRL